MKNEVEMVAKEKPAVGLSLGGVKKICAKLQEYGLLERKGYKRDGMWVTR